MSDTIHNVKETVRTHIDSTPEKVSAFFKTGKGEYAEHDKFLGITVPVIRKIAKKFLFIQLEDLALLIKSPFNEERLLALITLVYLYNIGSETQKEEIYSFYRTHLSYVNN